MYVCSCMSVRVCVRMFVCLIKMQNKQQQLNTYIRLDFYLIVVNMSFSIDQGVVCMNPVTGYLSRLQEKSYLNEIFFLLFFVQYQPLSDESLIH